MKKKILFVTESLARGGLERVLVDIANALSIRGYDVTIIAYHETDYLRNELNPEVTYQYVKRREMKILEMIPYIRWKYKKGFKQYKWETDSSPRKLHDYYVGKDHYDVEIAFYRGPSIKIVNGSTNKEAKRIAWVHTDFKLCDPKSISLFFHDMEEVKRAYNSFDNIVCVSEMARNSFVETIGCPERCSVIYNMGPIEKIRAKANQPTFTPTKHKFTIATLGRLIPDKGYDRLLKSVAKLNAEGFDFDVWLIGGGRAEDELKSLANELHLPNVTFLGMQENPYPILKQADLFICTSKREGFNIAIVEAMAFGLPVISTRCTGPVEILDEGKYGILVENSDEGVYSGLKQALSNPDSLSIFRNKSLERCLYFDEERIIKQIINLIEG